MMPKKGKSDWLYPCDFFAKEKRYICSDGRVIPVNPLWCFESVFFSRMFLATLPPCYWSSPDVGLSVDVSYPILKTIDEFCISRSEIMKAHADDDHHFPHMLKDFHVNFIQKHSGCLPQLMNAANELGMKSLYNLVSDAIIKLEKGKPIWTVDGDSLWNKAMLRYACMDDKIVRVDPRCCYESEDVRCQLIEKEEQEKDEHMKEFWGAEEGDIGQFPVIAHIPSNILEMVNDFCVSRAEILEAYAYVFDDDLFSRMLEAFDSCFLQKQPLTLLVQLMDAACKLKIKSLLHLTRNAIVDMLDGKSADEILKIFNLPDFNHEVWEGRHHHGWAHKNMMIF